jgi:hypothetical protein
MIWKELGSYMLEIVETLTLREGEKDWKTNQTNSHYQRTSRS